MRGTPWNVGWGCAAHFPTPLPYSWPKSTIFANPIYDRFGCHSCPKHKLWRAFSKKHSQFKNNTLFKTKMAEIDTLFMTKTAEKPYPLGPHIPIEPKQGSTPLPPGKTHTLFVPILWYLFLECRLLSCLKATVFMLLYLIFERFYL